MGSGKKTTKSTQTYKPPAWVESRAQQAASLASGYAAKPYQRYTGDRVAGLAENQRGAIDLAGRSVGTGQEDLGAARSALEGVEQFTDADMEAYMNPFIKGALDPTAREIRQEGSRREQDLAGSLTSRGAFSGSRAILAQREQAELTQQGISDLYGQGYAQAFDRGSALWQQDQQNKMQQSRQFMELAGMGSDLVNADMERLMETGELDRYVDQSMKDFDYQQFIEERDWSGRQAAYLTDVLRGLKGSYTETQKGKTESKESGNVAGQILGAAATIAGAYFSGGATLAGGAAASKAGG